ncbi:import inner membrane translocase subunit tim-50 [Ephemerocybe angulata]|uniref:Mitochondrial import inner membrane translocase subunit TIM50 n=1 Tax=Ephemerocybe angulata TaxID=980116 RepID=A0A8H6HT87_9AGAR|nr:import inner membrane translocase subunit tim-50 [Tulosesus angulatus]
MLSSIARSLARPAAAQRVRWASQLPPTGQGSKKSTPENASETAQDASSAKDAPVASGSTLPTLDFMPGGPEEPKRTGARSSKDTLSSAEKRRKLMSRVMLAILAGGVAAHTLYLGREWEADELKEKRLRLEDAPATRWARTAERFSDLFDYFNKPAFPELLPPPFPPPHGKPYTLVLSLDDLLITSTWDRQHGWRTAKRPGLDYFLAYISQFYEVVIFTSQPSWTADPIVSKLDRYNFFISHRLYREGTRSLNGSIAKDLSYLNRDLSKVIVLDTHPEHVRLQPENAIILPKWKGDPNDKGLIAVIPFLESIGIYKPADVRPILQAFEGKDVAIEYAKKEAEAKARHVEEWKAKTKGVSTSSISSLFGVSSAPAVPRGQPPPTYLEQKRKEAQHQYQEEQKYLRDNKEQLEKLLEQEQQAMAAMVPSNLWEAIDQISGKPKVPADATATPGTPATPATPATPSTTPTTPTA